MPRDLHASLLKPFVALATPGMYLFYKYSQYKRQQQEQNRRKVTERELAQLNHKIDKLLAKLEEHEPELASSQEEECVVCISAKASMQTFPCGHCVVCRKCFVKTIQMAVSQRLLPLRCVICRTKILRLKQMSGGGGASSVGGAVGGAVGGGSSRTISLCHSVSQTSRLTSLSSTSGYSSAMASVNVPPLHHHHHNHHHMHYHNFDHEYDERGAAGGATASSMTSSSSSHYQHRYHSIPELESISSFAARGATGSRHSSKSPSRNQQHYVLQQHGPVTSHSGATTKTSSLSSSASMPLVLPTSSQRHHSRHHHGPPPPSSSASSNHHHPHQYDTYGPASSGTYPAPAGTTNSIPRSVSRSSSRHGGASSVSSLPSPDSGVINKVLASMTITTPTSSKGLPGTKEVVRGRGSATPTGNGSGGGKSKNNKQPTPSSSNNNKQTSSSNKQPSSSGKEYKVTGTPEILYFKPVAKEKSTNRKSPFRAIHGKLPSLPKVTIRSRSSSKTLLIKKDMSSKE